MLHGFWVLVVLAGRAVGGGWALSGHGSQSLIILHFSPFGGGEGGWEENCDKVGDKCQEIFPPSFFLLLHHSAWRTPRGDIAKVACFGNISVWYAFAASSVAFDWSSSMYAEEGAIRWFWHRVGFEVGSVLWTTPRSGQGRGARVAPDPRREVSLDGLIPSDRERPFS